MTQTNSKHLLDVLQLMAKASWGVRTSLRQDVLLKLSWFVELPLTVKLIGIQRKLPERGDGVTGFISPSKNYRKGDISSWKPTEKAGRERKLGHRFYFPKALRQI